MTQERPPRRSAHRGLGRVVFAAFAVALAAWGMQALTEWTPARFATAVFVVVLALGWALAGAPRRSAG